MNISEKKLKLKLQLFLQKTEIQILSYETKSETEKPINADKKLMRVVSDVNLADQHTQLGKNEYGYLEKILS